MTNNVCDCGKPTRDAAYTCDDCLGGLTKALAEVPWLAGELETSMTRQKGVDYTSKTATTGGSKETPLPVDYGAFAAASQLRASLIAWTRRCHETNVPHQSPKDGLPILESVYMSRWLMWRVDGMGLRDWGSAAVADIDRVVQHGRRVIDRPADKWFAGPCNFEAVAGAACGRDMYVAPGKPQVICPACKTPYDVKDRRKWLLDAANDHLATATEIARAVTVLSEVSKGTTTLTRLISDWRTAGRLVERGHVTRRGQERPLYRVGDVVDMVEAHMTREQERRVGA